MKYNIMEEHVIFEKLELLNNTIAEKKSKKDLSKDDLSFYKTAIDFISERLKYTISALVTVGELNSASTDIDNSVISLNTFLGNKNQGHLTNSINQVKSAINRVRNFPIPISGSEFDFSKEIKNFKSVISGENSGLQDEVKKLNEIIDALREEIKKNKDELLSIEKSIGAKTEEIESLNKNFEDQYDKDRAEFIEKLGNEESKIKSNTDELVNYLKTKKTEAAKIVNVIGNIGATGNFQQIANDHKGAANFWRWVAIVFMAGLSGLVIWSILSLGNSEFDWTKTLIRIVAAAVLSYPATYAARESSKHRKLENYNRKLELELSSIEAFIELLPSEKKESIKEKLAEKYFGSTLDMFDDTDLKSDKDFSIQSIERLFNAVKSLK